MWRNCLVMLTARERERERERGRENEGRCNLLQHFQLQEQGQEQGQATQAPPLPLPSQWCGECTAPWTRSQHGVSAVAVVAAVVVVRMRLTLGRGQGHGQGQGQGSDPLSLAPALHPSHSTITEEEALAATMNMLALEGQMALGLGWAVWDRL